MKTTAFGKAARKYRVDHDMTQAELAAMIGVSGQHLSGVERGHKVMDPEGKTAANLPDELRRALLIEKAESMMADAKRLMDLASELPASQS